MDVASSAVRAWSTVRSMLADRGYAVPEGVGDDEVTALASEMTTFGVDVPAVAPLQKAVSVIFHLSEQSIKKDEMMAAAGSSDKLGLIVLCNMTPPSGASIKSLFGASRARGVEMEMFTLQELQYNVTRHELVPKHEPMSEDETASLLRRLRLRSRFHLPLILDSDPVARYLGLRHGTVVRIRRHSPCAGEAVAYRCCRSSAGAPARC